MFFPYTTGDMMWLWLALALLLLAAEAYTTAFYAVFIALGALGGAIAAGVGADTLTQMSVAAAVALIGAFLARPALMKFVEARRSTAAPAVFPGVQDIVGQGAVTTEPVGDKHHPGHALLANERWLAITEGVPLDADVAVTVVAVRGTTLVVRASDSPAS